MPALLDTNVVSELPKSKPDSNVVAYIAKQQKGSLFLSTVTLAELRYGILMAPAQRKAELGTWLDTEIRAVFYGCMLPLSETILLRWRILVEQGRKTGRTYSQPDLFLAATALEHNLTLVTRNTRDFTDIPGLQLLNPWEPTA